MSSDVFGAIERAGLESLLKRRHYGDGTVLMSEGEPADGCCFVESGDLRVELTASAERDRALVLGHVGPGGVVGEMGLVEGGVRTATVVTEGEVTVRWLFRDRFNELERVAPRVASSLSRRLLRDISNKMSETHERLRSYVSIEATENEATAAVRRAIEEGSPLTAAWTSEFLTEVPTETEIVDTLVEAGIDTFCLVADSVFASMDEYLMELEGQGRVNRWVVPSERSIPAVAAGRWLATGKLTAMSMQNSGFSNAMDYLRTVLLVHRIPGLVLSSWRGFDARLDDSEPHILVGDATDSDNRNTFGSAHVFGQRTGVGLRRDLRRAIGDAAAGHLSCLRVSPPGFSRRVRLREVDAPRAPTVEPDAYAALAARKGRPFARVREDSPVGRDEALVRIAAEMAPRNPFYIVGNGYNPRAMQALRLTDRTFENAGGMGSSLAIAWGAAKSDPSTEYVAIDGDQNAQMNEMEKVLCSDYPENLHWFILDNGTGESVGTSRSRPLAPWFYDLARVIPTRNAPPGSFGHPRINATGLKFARPEAVALAARIGNLPAQAHLARRILSRSR